MAAYRAITKTCNRRYTHPEPQNWNGVTRFWQVTNRAMVRSFPGLSESYFRLEEKVHLRIPNVRRPHANGDDDLCSPSRHCGISRYAYALDPVPRDRHAYSVGESQH